MPKFNICQRPHRYDSMFEDLIDHQGGESRHQCCGCAYESGFLDGASGKHHNPKPDTWDTSQAGTTRHKDAMMAYKWGYEAGENSKGAKNSDNS